MTFSISVKCQGKEKQKTIQVTKLVKVNSLIFTDWQKRHIVVPNNLFLLPTNDVVLMF